MSRCISCGMFPADLVNRPGWIQTATGWICNVCQQRKPKPPS